MNAPRLPIHVVKVGGSLLDWPKLPAALREWLAAQPPAVQVLICGGGPLTDVIRQADRAFSLGEEAAHWLCIDALAVSARLLSAVLAGLPLIESLGELPASGPAVFDPRRFLIEEEPRLPGCVLPHTWAATTDSIAARVTEVMEAPEVVLLKSADPPTAASMKGLAAAGYVDAHFPSAAAAIAEVRFVNLRRFSACS